MVHGRFFMQCACCLPIHTLYRSKLPGKVLSWPLGTIWGSASCSKTHRPNPNTPLHHLVLRLCFAHSCRRLGCDSCWDRGVWCYMALQTELNFLMYCGPWYRSSIMGSVLVDVVNKLQASMLCFLHHVNGEEHCDNTSIATATWQKGSFIEGDIQPLRLVTLFWMARGHWK